MSHPWSFFCVQVIAAAGFLSASCALPHSLRSVFDNSGHAEKVIISSPDEFFLASDQLFHDGRYRNALRITRRIYQEASDPLVEEEALFRIALILSYGDNPKRNYREAEKVARAFLKRYPESKRGQEVRTILRLLQEVHRGEAEIKTLKGYNAIQEEKMKRLKEDMRKIKEIDLQLEEQKKKLE